ncbi:LamG-like jellyroll fold domain-containing protein [Carboxylicivirga caseinilyticus]|uniref:LamG-like jellyroll fold domain-containing protein n=1 Tax=Carboxylicivirga caseinilyticus TaxID=3417572 RepID=UPI003D352222|nr:T9SS type A sorting domain-containing protein [Marinilabiliaceae bacterium A049]
MNVRRLLFSSILFLTTIPFLNAQQISTEQIKCYLKFDNNLDNSSTSGATFSQTVGNDLTYDTGKFGEAGYFNDMAVVSSGIDFNPVNSFTLMAWVQMDQLSFAQTWVHQKDVSGQNFGRIHMEVLDANVLGSFTDGIRCDDNTAISAGTWYHCAVVKDASAGKRYIYVNGILVNEVNGGNESNTGEIVLGARKNETEYFVKGGLMDELLLTYEVLDATTINSIMNDGVAAAMTSTSIKKMPLQANNYYSNGQIHLSFSGDVSAASYAIYDVTGKCLLEDNISTKTNSIPVNLRKGLYILKVSSEEGVVSSKFMVK